MPRRKRAVPAYRSKFEERLGAELTRAGIQFQYEHRPFAISVPTGHKCQRCEADVYRKSRFTPDFFIGQPKLDGYDGWIIEAKGKFTANDRKRLLALVGTYGMHYKFGILFMRDNKLSKSSNTRYSDWCKQHGIEYAVGTFKKEWLE